VLQESFDGIAADVGELLKEEADRIDKKIAEDLEIKVSFLVKVEALPDGSFKSETVMSYVPERVKRSRVSFAGQRQAGLFEDE